MNTNLDLLDEEFSSSPNKNKRSPYLLVLCILSFVGCAGYLGIFTFMNIMLSQERDYSSIYGSRDYLDYVIPWTSICIGSGVVCAGSAVLMLLRYQFGYFIYLFAQLVPSAFMFIYHREMRITSDDEEILMFFFIASTLLFPILYAFAYKSMRR